MRYVLDELDHQGGKKSGLLLTLFNLNAHELSANIRVLVLIQSEAEEYRKIVDQEVSVNLILYKCINNGEWNCERNNECDHSPESMLE